MRIRVTLLEKQAEDPKGRYMGGNKIIKVRSIQTDINGQRAYNVVDACLLPGKGLPREKGYQTT